MWWWECIHFWGSLAAAFGGLPTSLRPYYIAALKRLCSLNMQAMPYLAYYPKTC